MKRTSYTIEYIDETGDNRWFHTWALSPAQALRQWEDAVAYQDEVHFISMSDTKACGIGQ